VYAPFCATAAGIVGSLIGFTLFGALGSLAVGLLAIIGGELTARYLLRPRSTSKL
jgi:hypothetical protein